MAVPARPAPPARPAAPPPSPTPGLAARRTPCDGPGAGKDWYPWQVLCVTTLGSLLVFTNSTAVNVALPAISADLGTTTATADWFLLSFMLAMTMSVMVFGRVSDILGRRRLYLAGLVVMTLASLAGAFAQEPAVLVATRLVQGVAAASIITNANAQIADAFPQRLLATGLSFNVMTASAASAVGPAVGGALVTAFGWRSLFLVNVPFGVLGLLLGARVLRRARARTGRRERFDVAGAVLSATALAALLLGINRSSAWGWADQRVYVLLGVAALAFTAFVLVERRVADPLVDLALVRHRARGLAYGTALLMSLAQSGVVVLVVLHEQMVRQAPAAEAGLRAVPVALAIMAFSPVGGLLARWLSARTVGSLGGGCSVLGYVLLAGYFATTTPFAPAGGLLLTALGLIGAGIGIFTSPNTAAILGGLPASRRGIANGVRSALYNGGQAMGTALTLLVVGRWLGTPDASSYASRLDGAAAAVTPGFAAAATLLAFCAVGATACSLARGGPWTARTGRPDARRERSRAVPDALRRHRWWIVRTLVLPVHIAVFATMSFFLVRLVPGDPVLSALEGADTITPEDYARAADAMGLSGSVWEQLGTFWAGLVRLDLGTSTVTGRPIWQEIWDRLPATVELVLVGLGGAVVLALVLGLVLLRVRNRAVQKVLRGYARLAGAVPDFAVAILGLVLLYGTLRVIPAPIGRISPGLRLPDVTGFPILDSLVTGSWEVLGSMLGHLALPVAVMVLVYTPTIWKQLALGLDESAAAPATLFRIASGAGRVAVYTSILRRAAASAVVMVGALFGGLVGGVVVLEQLFGLGGIGQFAIDSVESVDFLGLQGFLVAIAALCLVAFFAVDIVNMLLDPRRRPGASVDV